MMTIKAEHPDITRFNEFDFYQKHIDCLQFLAQSLFEPKQRLYLRHLSLRDKQASIDDADETHTQNQDFLSTKLNDNDLDFQNKTDFKSNIISDSVS